MYKKILLVSALALGLSSAAFAAEQAKTGPVVTPAPAKCADVTTSTDDSFAAPVVDASTNDNYYRSSIYFGGQGLITNMHYANSAYTLPTNSASSTKPGVRAYLGYAFNQFLALELGYDYFGRPELQDNVGNTQEFSQQGMDLALKATLPLDYGFGVFIKGGGIWVWRSDVYSRMGEFVAKGANNKITPFAGLGVSYNFMPAIGIDLSYSRSMTVSDLPKMDIFALGISYKINM